MISPDFIPGYIAFIKSLLLHNSWFEYPIVLIDLGLKEEQKKECREYYKNIVFKKPKREKYKRVNWKKTQKHLRNTYYTLDMFSYLEYERIVFIDLDTLVLKNIYYLFNHKMKNFFGGVKAYNRSQDCLVEYLNAGVMVVDLNRLPENFYQNIVSYSCQGFQFPEQDALDTYLKGKIDFLPKCYNVEKRMLLSYNHPFDIYDVGILHYVGIKPWQEPKKPSHFNDKKDFYELDLLWREYYTKELNND